MTANQIKTKLEPILTPLLGDYTFKGITQGKAISEGEPPAGLTASGIEVIISLDPELDAEALQGYGVQVNRLWDVRVIQHGTGSFNAVVELILRTYPGALVRVIPANPGASIPRQTLLRIPEAVMLGA